MTEDNNKPSAQIGRPIQTPDAHDKEDSKRQPGQIGKFIPEADKSDKQEGDE